MSHGMKDFNSSKNLVIILRGHTPELSYKNKMESKKLTHFNSDIQRTVNTHMYLYNCIDQSKDLYIRSLWEIFRRKVTNRF